MADSRPRVSVVIPTRARPATVVRAVNSVLNQTYPAHEVIVVVDGPDPETCKAIAAKAEPRIRALELTESRGAGGARNAGIEAATGDFVAFLDDDDEWLRDKLAAQMKYIELCGGSQTVVGTQAIWNRGADSLTWPTRPPRRAEPVADYLFVRNHAGEGLLPTPTLLLSTALAQSCPFPVHLKGHEEWDWMLDLERRGASFSVVMEPLVRVDARPNRASLSSSTGWRSSLSWALSRGEDMSPRAFSAFVLTEVARAAATGRAPLSAQFAILVVSLTGRPRVRDLLRFCGRLLVVILKRSH